MASRKPRHAGMVAKLEALSFGESHFFEVPDGDYPPELAKHPSWPTSSAAAGKRGSPTCCSTAMRRPVTTSSRLIGEED